MKTLPLALALTASVTFAAPPEPKFTAQDLDVKIEIGYGVAVADVDGDGKPDVLLADKKQFAWYRNPGKRGTAWDKFILAENLTEKDNVCIAARDIDGDGKCEIAVGAEWNPGDTVNSGAVFYLIPPADRTHRWDAVKFPSVEPTTHRMKWVRIAEKEWGLVVVPLHGRGNKNGEGVGVKVLLYKKPADPRGEWKSEVLDDSMHATHNIDVVKSKIPIGLSDVSNLNPEIPELATTAIITGGKEGVFRQLLASGHWSQKRILVSDGKPGSTIGVGEVREAALSWEASIATIEPMHGNQLCVYWIGNRRVLTDKLIQGHALACGDLLGAGSDQIVVGWRGAKPGDKVGIAVWTPLDDKGAQWRESLIDDNTMACEDLVLADLNGDGKLDIVASGRATKNVKIYWNER